MKHSGSLFRLLFYISFVLYSYSLLSCQNPHSKAEHSFYYWKTTFPYVYDDTQTLARIHSLNIQHFYLRYLDVDWSENLNMPVPVAQLNDINYYNVSPFVSGKYTPVIFITNRSFQRMTDAWCDTLAGRIKNKINQLTEEIEKAAEDHAYWETPFPDGYRGEHQDSIRNATRKQRKNNSSEIQIDCDWTASTKEKYFHFLRSLKRQFPDKKISATIRLYPYKYSDKTGVPPVDKGLLMCYNLSEIKSPATKNSVFDLTVLKQYLTVKNYPLPLDIALPVFGWQAWFRGNNFQGILYDRDEQILSDTTIFKTKDVQTTIVMQDQAVGNNYLREGDVLRHEYPDERELEEAAELLMDKLPATERIAFYYWDTLNINRYENTIRKIYDRW